MSREYVAISKRFIKRIMFFVVLLAAAGGVVYGFTRYQDSQEKNKQAQAEIERLKNPEESAKIAEDALIEEVKKVALVPTDERPTIANVTDSGQLKDQPLFALIENDDKVLLYPNARRQIVYRPSTKQVITAVTLPEGDAATEQDASQQDAAENNPDQ